MTRNAIGSQVAAAMRRGRRVQAELRTITTKALTEAQFDRAALKRAMREVAGAIRDAGETQGEGARRSMRQAVSGMDRALADAAFAFRLSLQEAAAAGAVFARAAAGALTGIAGSVERRAAKRVTKRRARRR